MLTLLLLHFIVKIEPTGKFSAPIGAKTVIAGKFVIVKTESETSDTPGREVSLILTLHKFDKVAGTVHGYVPVLGVDEVTVVHAVPLLMLYSILTFETLLLFH